MASAERPAHHRAPTSEPDEVTERDHNERGHPLGGDAAAEVAGSETNGRQQTEQYRHSRTVRQRVSDGNPKMKIPGRCAYRPRE